MFARFRVVDFDLSGRRSEKCRVHSRHFKACVHAAGHVDVTGCMAMSPGRYECVENRHRQCTQGICLPHFQDDHNDRTSACPSGRKLARRTLQQNTRPNCSSMQNTSEGNQPTKPDTHTHTRQPQLGRVNFSGTSTNGQQKRKCYPRLVCEVQSAVGARATAFFTSAWDGAHQHRYEQGP